MNTDDARYDDLQAELEHDAAFEVSEQERREALITAYALGQLDAAETADIERLLADPSHAAARRQVDDMRAIAAAVQGRGDDDSLTRSVVMRRNVVAAVARAEPLRRSAGWRRWSVVVGALAASLVIAVTLPSIRTFMPPKTQATRERLVADARSAAGPQPEAQETSASPVAEERVIAGADALATRAVRRLEAPAERASEIAAAPPLVSGAFSEAGDIPHQSIGILDRVDMNRESPSGERYAAITESRLMSPKDHPLSTFSIDVDTASYSNVRRFLDTGRLPPRDAVRIEELINSFRYEYPQPEGDAPFSVTVDAAECPWKRGHRLVRIGLQGRAVDRGARPAGNLVFLIDVSGSMQAANKLPLVQQALSMLVEQLSENDRVSIVTYAGNAGLVLPPTTGDQKQTIRAAIDSLAAGGSTHGSAGIALAYEQAREHFVEGGVNRVILATDGDVNVGVTSTDALTHLIKEKAKGGVFLTVLGFGEGNLQDEKMEALADNGNGIYAYIDGVREARKVLVEQLAESTVTIAKDVKIQVEFNPAQVASYRLLGYENRALAARDFRDDTKDAGEIGAGHSVTALYEIELVDEAVAGVPGVEQLKYQPNSESKDPALERAVDPKTALDQELRRELLTVKLRWKRPDANESTGLEVPLADRGSAFEEAPADMRFAAAVAAYGMILRNSDQRGDATLPLVAKIAGNALGRDEGGYRAEFLDLVSKAQSLGCH